MTQSNLPWYVEYVAAQETIRGLREALASAEIGFALVRGFVNTADPVFGEQSRVLAILDKNLSSVKVALAAQPDAATPLPDLARSVARMLAKFDDEDRAAFNECIFMARGYRPAPPSGDALECKGPDA